MCRRGVPCPGTMDYENIMANGTEEQKEALRRGATVEEYRAENGGGSATPTEEERVRKQLDQEKILGNIQKQVQVTIDSPEGFAWTADHWNRKGIAMFMLAMDTLQFFRTFQKGMMARAFTNFDLVGVQRAKATEMTTGLLMQVVGKIERTEFSFEALVQAMLDVKNDSEDTKSLRDDPTNEPTVRHMVMEAVRVTTESRKLMSGAYSMFLDETFPMPADVEIQVRSLEKTIERERARGGDGKGSLRGGPLGELSEQLIKIILDGGLQGRRPKRGSGEEDPDLGFDPFEIKF